MRQTVKSLISAGLEWLLWTRPGVKLYERIFEAAPHRLSDLMVRLQNQPNFDFSWTTRLLNGRRVRIEVRADDPRTWEFAHAYHWHDVEIRDVEYSLLCKFAADGIAPIFFDIGANFGLRSLLPLSMGLRCILFEPNRDLREFTTSLFAKNGFCNYELENVCLSDQVGSASFYLSANSYMSSLDRSWLADDRGMREIEVPVTTFDDWIGQRPQLANMPSIIKIDVEGAELRVLQGARNYIERRAPLIICEIEMDVRMRERIWDFCESLQYDVHSIRESKARRAMSVGRSSFLSLAGETNFLLAPRLAFIGWR